MNTLLCPQPTPNWQERVRALQRAQVQCITIPPPAPIPIQSHQTHYLGLKSTLNLKPTPDKNCVL